MVEVRGRNEGRGKQEERERKRGKKEKRKEYSLEKKKKKKKAICVKQIIQIWCKINYSNMNSLGYVITHVTSHGVFWKFVSLKPINFGSS